MAPKMPQDRPKTDPRRSRRGLLFTSTVGFDFCLFWLLRWCKMASICVPKSVISEVDFVDIGMSCQVRFLFVLDHVSVSILGAIMGSQIIEMVHFG